MMAHEITAHLIELEKESGAKAVREGCRKYMLRRTFAGELPEKRKQISPSRKAKLYALQNGRCNSCHDPYDIRALEVDEFIPASRGGERVKGNIQLLCHECNKAKTNHTPSQEAKRTGVGITEQISRLPIEDQDA